MKGVFMLMEQTMEKLSSMRLTGMLEALEEQIKSKEISSLSFEERIGLLVDHQWNWKENRALNNRMKKASFKHQACVEDIDYRTPRKLIKADIAQLSLSNWITQHHNCIITGPTGVGKTYLACAIGQKACRNGFNVLYYYIPKLFREMEIASTEGKLPLFLHKLMRTHLLIIDDWGMKSLTSEQYKDFLEILDDRHQVNSTLITSQFPVKLWHDNMGNPTVADAILDRLIHNCHKIELNGPSMRKVKITKNKGKKS